MLCSRYLLPPLTVCSGCPNSRNLCRYLATNTHDIIYQTLLRDFQFLPSWKHLLPALQNTICLSCLKSAIKDSGGANTWQMVWESIWPTRSWEMTPAHPRDHLHCPAVIKRDLIPWIYLFYQQFWDLVADLSPPFVFPWKINFCDIFALLSLLVIFHGDYCDWYHGRQGCISWIYDQYQRQGIEIDKTRLLSKVSAWIDFRLSLRFPLHKG